MNNSFRELRLKAGYKSTPIANALGVNYGTVWGWDQGDRPRWRYMPELAQFFGIDLAEIVIRLWGETIGDPCPCGCSGKKAPPEQQKALNLAIELPCTGCGKIRSYQGKEHLHSTVLCRRCSYDSRSLGPPVKLKCVGYHPYGARAASFANNCPGETQKKRKRLKYYKQTQDDGQHAFIDVAGGKYRCKWCAGALFLIYKLEKDVKEFLAKAKPKETVPKIESLKQLLECRRACSNLSYTDDSGAVKVFDQYSFAHNEENKHKWGPRANSVAQRTGLLITRSKQANVVKGLCQFCGKIVFSAHETRASKVHAKCYQEQAGSTFRKGVPPERPKRWRPISLENLRKNYSWAMRHRLGGESLGQIAEEFGVAKSTVVDGIDSILARLPEPELVNKKFWDRICRLRSP